jgi:Fur family peroxide stress response transcriptional regulator
MGNQPNATDHNYFADLCRSHNLKVTPQRTAIFKKLTESRSHPSAEDIFQSLRDDFPNMSFDTVYRTLNTFAEIGIAEVVEDYGNSRRFDANPKEHHHLHCIKCGNIIDIYNVSFDKLEIPGHIKDKFKILTRRVVLTGFCEECREL